MQSITLKRNKHQLRTLWGYFNDVVYYASITPSMRSPYNYLLTHHAIELKELIEKKLQKEQKNYTVKLTELQALAFCFLSFIKRPSDEYMKLQLQMTIDEIHKFQKNQSVFDYAKQ